MEEPDRRNAEPEPGEEHLENEQSEENAMAPEAPLADACDRTDDQKEECGENEDVAEERVSDEPVEEDILVDRGPFVVELVRRVERAVPGQPDLHDDRREEHHRPRPVDRSHVPLLPSLTAQSLRHTMRSRQASPLRET